MYFAQLDDIAYDDLKRSVASCHLPARSSIGLTGGSIHNQAGDRLRAEGVRTLLRRYVVPLLWLVLVANTWLLLAHLVVNIDAGDMALTEPEALLTCALLVVAPALVFLPVASRLAAPFFDAEAILGWGTLGFVVVFLRPSSTLTYGQFLALLLPLTVAVASLATLLAYAFVRRLQPHRERARNILQARRIGYLAAVALVALVLLKALALLTPFNGTLVIAVAVLAELFAVASRRPSSPAV